MLTPQRTRKRIVRNCGWVLFGGLTMWLTTETVSALKPRPADASPKKGQFKPDDAKSGLASLDLKKMLSRAQQNHPAIRAAEAKLAAARAELDLTRQQVAKEVIETRKQWRSAKGAVAAAKAELQAAERSGGSLPAERYREFVRTANERLKLAREDLAAAEVRLELLVGKAAVDGKQDTNVLQREKVLHKLRSITQQMVKTATGDWRIGKADGTELFTATRRLARIDIALAKTKAEKLAAIEAYVKNLKELQNIAEQLYRSGKAPQGDVLSIQYAVTEAELWKLELE